MRSIFIALSIIILSVLAGCATLSKSQCQTGDWRSVGEADGRAGFSTARFSEHNEACVKHGIKIDRTLYNQGHAAGLKLYCTTDNAAKIGIAGRTYNNVCTGEIGTSFLRIYREANDVYSINRDIKSLQSQIESLTERLANPTTAQSDRDNIVIEIRSLNNDIARKQADRLREDAELRQVLIEEQNRLAKL